MQHARSFFSLATIALVMAGATYTAALCFLNTNLVGISNAAVAVADGAIVIAALIICLWRSDRATWMIVLALALNFLLLAVISEQTQLKAVRDPLVVLTFAYLGMRYGSFGGARLAFFLIAAIVLVFAALEYLAPAAFVHFFNIMDFYRARGAIDAETVRHMDSVFFVSGVRPDARTLLPFLGPHRGSSIFLEPVSMGNFGAIAVAFALSLERKHWRTALAAAVIGAVAIILADARFAATVIALFALTRLVPVRWSDLAVAPLPVIAIGFLLAFAMSNVGHGDDLPTRLATSGRVLLELSPAALLGFDPYGVSTVDSGYAYAFTTLGLPMCMALWAAFVVMPARTRQGARFKLMLGVYICTLLCISGSSLFALKTAALTWFIAGALAAPQQLRARIMPRPTAAIAPQGAV